MCTNSALVDSLECYMEDMVDCFEDFVKKSLVIITLAVGALVGMLVYLLKTMNDRGGDGIRARGGGGAQRITDAENSAFRGSGLADVKNAHSAITQAQGYGYSEGRGKTSFSNRLRKDEAFEDEDIENDEFTDNTISTYKDNVSSKYEDYSTQENIEERDTKRVRSSSSQFNVNKNSSKTRDYREMIDDPESFEIKRTASNNSVLMAKRINSNTKLPLPKDGMRTSSKSCIICPKSSSKCIRKTISSCGTCSNSVVSSCEEVPTRDSSDIVCPNCPRKTSQLRKPCNHRSNCPK